MSCALPIDAYLEARVAGAIEGAIEWQAKDMNCDGMRRPDGEGLRVTFSGAHGAEHLTLVFGVPHLPEGAEGRAVPVNVTLIREGGGLYSTRGGDKCVLDSVHQYPLEVPELPTAKPAAGTPSRHWRIEARGFCLEPARAVGDSRSAIMLSTFDFRGQLTWEPDPPPTSPLIAPAPAKPPEG